MLSHAEMRHRIHFIVPVVTVSSRSAIGAQRAEGVGDAVLDEGFRYALTIAVCRMQPVTVFP